MTSLISLASSGTYILCLIIASGCAFWFAGVEKASGQSGADADSLSYYQEMMDDAERPEEFEEARSWLNRHYRSQVSNDESMVPDYELADPLVTEGGRAVEETNDWFSVRRPEIIEIFKENVYGRVPEFSYETEYKIHSVDPEALNGLATQKQVTILFDEGHPDLSIDLLIYLPNHTAGPVPAVTGLNFYGNQTVHSDREILMSRKWMRPNTSIGIRNNRATEETRGVYSERWQVEKVLKRGYALVTAYAGDIEPDEHNRMKQGVRSLAYSEQTMPADDEWGTIAAWAWGLSRMMDYMETDAGIDQQRIAVLGHSRLGKAALWAGALDERFAVVVSNNSGCGGAALSSRRFGETVGVINTSFPHWFCANFNQFNGREETLPADQHMLLSLIAPRPLYVASAAEDLWADPRGEFLSARHASPVYELFGLEGVPAASMPGIDQPVRGTIGYHLRSGGHAVTLYDWENYLDFMDGFFIDQ